MRKQIYIPLGLTPCEQRAERKRIAKELEEKTTEALLNGLPTKEIDGLICGAKTRSREGHCARFCLAGYTRCYLHGGRSTGPKTAEGKSKCAAARWKKEETGNE